MTTNEFLNWGNKHLQPSLIRDEYERYCKSERVYGFTSAVSWWLEETQRKNYPNLSKMAVDILSIPAMSAEPERLFSGAKITITDRRNRLGRDVIEALECLKSWLGLQDIQESGHTNVGHSANARGLMSGILQQGYSLGYVLAACANLGVGGIGMTTSNDKDARTDQSDHSIAGISIAVGLVRILFPESKQFLEAKKAGKKTLSPGAFWRDVKKMLGQEWKMCIYCIVLMTWFNYYSHTSQDSYTTFMLTQKELSNAGASRASIIMKAGACVGGCIIGYLSQFVGRRRAIIVSALMSAILIPAWILPESERALSVTGFFMQFFVQGAWGVIPIHLNELSPVAFRSTFPGVTYQIGNMISSPSAQIVNAVAEKTFVTLGSGRRVEAYGPTMGIATAIIALGIIVATMLGPERLGRSFEYKVAGIESDSANNSDRNGLVWSGLDTWTRPDQVRRCRPTGFARNVMNAGRARCSSRRTLRRQLSTCEGIWLSY
ncbi:major facilitator superfamily transporter [Purpureocillium lilacinum]|uniref:Major facilitator superfamily transporter n=1 Tax=Purpureocillium lilacinum TaxID=33203 RepID=A0A179F5V1_PURLI|nr:major facilitator superfamily transporter [Purpureocillium lilacinum]OAQ60805.1 major facilitator superfamily transporter [Purpureocillium lilacinum]